MATPPNPGEKGKGREIAERLAVALGARLLWEIIVKLLHHAGV